MWMFKNLFVGNSKGERLSWNSFFLEFTSNSDNVKGENKITYIKLSKSTSEIGLQTIET